MRRSGPESTNTVVPPARTKTDDLSRRLRGSSEVQTAQPQPITGTPTDVPVPRNVNETPATAVILHATPWQATIGKTKASNGMKFTTMRFFRLRHAISTPTLIVFK